MKQSPIIYSTEMVKAILEGRKTQTRRIFKGHPRLASDISKIDWKQWFRDYRDLILSYSPYGKPGDLLWVRETFDPTGCLGSILFKANYTNTELIDGNHVFKWKPSIHMPKTAARIWLEITDIRVERLQDITEEDAIAEGVKSLPDFAHLWGKIHSPESWNRNPWVWAISFKPTEKPSTI